MSDKTLYYSPIDKRARLRRLLSRAAVILIFLLTAAAFYFCWPQIHYQYTLYLRRQAWKPCLDYSLPPTQVVYEEDPTRFAPLKATLVPYVEEERFVAIGKRQPILAHNPKIFDDIFKDDFYNPRCLDATLFLHRRDTPSGQKCIVRASSIRRWSFNVIMLVVRRASDPDADPVRSLIQIDRSNNAFLRFYAGQPDPTDPSHFTIDYDYGAIHSSIDCYLDNDLNVTVTFKSGTVSRYPFATFPKNYFIWHPTP